MPRCARWPILLLVVGLSACTSTFVTLDFAPSPAQTLVDDGGGLTQARVLASVLSAERPGDDEERPFELHLRVRVESLGAEPVVLDEPSVLLVDAALSRFPAPRLELGEGDASTGALSVAPHSARSFDLYFPMEGRSPRSIDALNLRLQLRVGERDVLVGANFEKRRSLQVLRPPNAGFYGPYFGSFYGPYYGSFYGHSSLGVSHFHR